MTLSVAADRSRKRCPRTELTAAAAADAAAAGDAAAAAAADADGYKFRQTLSDDC